MFTKKPVEDASFSDPGTHPSSPPANRSERARRGNGAASIIGQDLVITGNLHSEQAREIMQLFRRLNDEGTTIVQVTHSAENAAFGKRTVRMADGWLKGEEPTR